MVHRDYNNSRHSSLREVNRDTVKQLDQRALAARLGPVDTASLTGVRVIAIDEFAIHRGHRYATVIADPRTKRVLWVGQGRRREDVRPFFELLGEEGRARLEAVVMDMSGPYAEEDIKLIFPKNKDAAQCRRDVERRAVEVVLCVETGTELNKRAHVVAMHILDSHHAGQGLEMIGNRRVGLAEIKTFVGESGA